MGGKVKSNLDIYKTTSREYSWRLLVGTNEIARMPDGTGAPSKIKRTVRALQARCGVGSDLHRACSVALDHFETLHPTPKVAIVNEKSSDAVS